MMCGVVIFFGKPGALLRDIRPLVYDQHHMTEKKEALYRTWGHLLDSAINISSSVSLHPTSQQRDFQSCSHMLRVDLCISTSESSECDSNFFSSPFFPHIIFPQHIDFPRVQTEHISLWLGFQNSSKTMENNWEEKPWRYLLIRTYAQQTQVYAGIYCKKPTNSKNHLNAEGSIVHCVRSLEWQDKCLVINRWLIIRKSKKRDFLWVAVHTVCADSTLWRIRVMLTTLLIIKHFSHLALAPDMSLIILLLPWYRLV